LLWRWKEVNFGIKGNFVWEDGLESKVVFQPDENGRWEVHNPPEYKNHFKPLYPGVFIDPAK